MKSLCAIALLIFTGTASAQNTESKALQEVRGHFNADNRLRTGFKADVTMDFGTGMAGALFGVYGIARGFGEPGDNGVHDIVGVHGTAIKSNRLWASGMHCDVYDLAPGGTSICLDMEFPQTNPGTTTIGLNMQPHISARDLIGIQLQNPWAFKTGPDMVNMNWIFGEVDGHTFGFRFDPATQALRFYRNIGQSDELQVGEIKMDFGQVK